MNKAIVYSIPRDSLVFDKNIPLVDAGLCQGLGLRRTSPSSESSSFDAESCCGIHLGRKVGFEGLLSFLGQHARNLHFFTCSLPYGPKWHHLFSNNNLKLMLNYTHGQTAEEEGKLIVDLSSVNPTNGIVTDAHDIVREKLGLSQMKILTVSLG